jgi:hypothetical protein
VQIYPNPFRDRLNISFSLQGSGTVRISLLDAFGREVARLADESGVTAGTFSGSYSIGNLNPGVYYCRIQTGSFTTVKKVILSR